jgi:hypothetical protein
MRLPARLQLLMGLSEAKFLQPPPDTMALPVSATLTRAADFRQFRLCLAAGAR